VFEGSGVNGARVGLPLRLWGLCAAAHQVLRQPRCRWEIFRVRVARPAPTFSQHHVHDLQLVLPADLRFDPVAAIVISLWRFESSAHRLLSTGIGGIAFRNLP